MNSNYRVLVLSDLHAVVGDSSERSASMMDYADGSAPRDLLSLCQRALLDEFESGVDLVVVCGDITDKASSGALQRAWADLHWFAAELKSPLVATSGNHDYDSRTEQGPLPYNTLMGLRPNFPLGDANDRNKYFAEQHAIYADQHAIVITANSVAHHGYSYDGTEEHEHGRYAEQLPALIGESLDSIPVLPPVKILITHHHLSQLPEIDTEERSASIGHESVLRKLGEYGSWIVIHGHKHRGWVQYASGNGDAPPLISSSSFSADFGKGTFVEKVRHQFHVVSVPISDELEVDDGITGARGHITSWTHSPLGWKIAAAKEQLPGFSGFGWKANLEKLAAKVRSHLAVESFLGWDELLHIDPRMEFLTFDDLNRLVGWLERGTPGVTAVVGDHGRLVELSLDRAKE